MKIFQSKFQLCMKIKSIYIRFFFHFLDSSFFTIHEPIVNDSFTEVNQIVFPFEVSHTTFMKKIELFRKASIFKL